MSIIKSGELDEVVLENLFMELDEKYYEDTYELTKIIMQELAYSSHINICKFIERNSLNKDKDALEELLNIISSSIG